MRGRNFLLRNPLLALAPGFAIIVTVVALNIFSDGLHQYLSRCRENCPALKNMRKSSAERQVRPDPWKNYLKLKTCLLI